MSSHVSKGALALAAVLAACAGGGEDGGGGCPPGSVITVVPTSARVTAGGPAIDFGGGVSNCEEMINWSLAGPGSLDRTQGVPVKYTPPASVATVTVATLTASVGPLAAAAIITVDPAVQGLAGRVIAASGAPIAGAVVWVGDDSATTDAGGAFSLAGVAVPYDVTATSPDGLVTSFYPGLRRMDPTLTLFDVDGGFPRSGAGTGALSGGAGFPQPTGRITGVSFRAPGAAGSCPVAAGQAAFELWARWSGPATVTGSLHALQWQVDADGRPVGYDGYGSLAGVTVVAGGPTATGLDLALGAVGTKGIGGTIVNPPYNTVGMSVTAVLADGARIRIVPRPGDPSPFPTPGFQTPFGIPTPAIPGATIELVAHQDYVGMAWQEVHRHGLAPDATGLEVVFGGLAVQDAPPAGSTGVRAGTTFRWYDLPDPSLFVVSFRGPPGAPGYDVFVAGRTFTVPLDFVLPLGVEYSWRVRGTSAFTTVEEAAGPGGFFASAPAYRISQGLPWTFTTATTP